jgi:hypothetical protein
MGEHQRDTEKGGEIEIKYVRMILVNEKDGEKEINMNRCSETDRQRERKL